MVFSVSLKRVRYRRSVSTGSTDEGHLQWNSQKVRTLRAGTVEKIVERLVPYGEEVDVSYRACFLCTFRTFTTVQDVLRILIERYTYNTGYYIVRSDYSSQLFKLRCPKYHCEKILIELHNAQSSVPFWIFHCRYSIDNLVYGLPNCLTSIASMFFFV